MSSSSWEIQKDSHIKEAVNQSFDSALVAAKNSARELHRVSGAHITNIRVYTDYRGIITVKTNQEFSDNAY